MLQKYFYWRPPKIPIFDRVLGQRVIEEEYRKGLNAGVTLGTRLVQERTPVGATGILGQSIQGEVLGTGANLHGEVFTTQIYGAPVEYGTRPHWAPIAPLKLWAKRILGDERAAYAVQRRIAGVVSGRPGGTEGVHMFRNAFQAAQGRIIGFMKTANTRISQRLLGR